MITICNETKTFADQIGVSILDKSKTYLALSNTATFVPPDVNSISIKELLHIPLITSVASQEQNFQNEILKILHKHGALNIGFSAPGPELIDSLVVQNLGGTPYLKFKYFSDPAHYRFISIKNMPKFVLVLLYNKAIPQEKLDFILTLIEQIKR